MSDGGDNIYININYVIANQITTMNKISMQWYLKYWIWISTILCHRVVIAEIYTLYIGWALLSDQQHINNIGDSVAQSMKYRACVCSFGCSTQQTTFIIIWWTFRIEKFKPDCL